MFRVCVLHRVASGVVVVGCVLELVARAAGAWVRQLGPVCGPGDYWVCRIVGWGLQLLTDCVLSWVAGNWIRSS